MIKTRVHRAHMASMLNWYNEQMTQRFGLIILSEAQRELVRRDFSILQNRMRQQEKTNCWQVPLQVEFDNNGTFKVSIIDEKTVLYLD